MKTLKTEYLLCNKKKNTCILCKLCLYIATIQTLLDRRHEQLFFFFFCSYKNRVRVSQNQTSDSVHKFVNREIFDPQKSTVHL